MHIDTYEDVFDNYDIKYIQYFDNVFTPKECKEFIKLHKHQIKNGKGYQGAIGSSSTVDSNRKISIDTSLIKYHNKKDKTSKPYKLLQLYGNKIQHYLNMYLLTVCYFGIRPLMEYLNTKKALRMPDTIALSCVNIRKYPKNTGGYFIPHWDRQGTAHKKRITAIIVYLNTIEYGGETIFPVLGKRIRPKAGRVVIFPSDYTHLHYGNSSPQDKYIIAGHVEDMTTENTTKETRRRSNDKEEKTNTNGS